MITPKNTKVLRFVARFEKNEKNASKIFVFYIAQVKLKICYLMLLAESEISTRTNYDLSFFAVGKQRQTISKKFRVKICCQRQKI